jgi:hypothetical protein
VRRRDPHATPVAGSERDAAAHRPGCGADRRAAHEGSQHEFEFERCERRTEAAVCAAAEGEIAIGVGRVVEEALGAKRLGLRVAVDPPVRILAGLGNRSGMRFFLIRLL